MPPVASPETTCWIRMSILSGGERAPLLPHAPQPLRSLRRDSRWLVHRSVFGALINWLIEPSVSEIGAADGVVLFELGGGARPSEGSSSKSKRGRDMSARATASICCSPPESVPACCRRRWARTGKYP